MSVPVLIMRKAAICGWFGMTLKPKSGPIYQLTRCLGMRAFFSNPRATLQIDSGTLTAGSAQNLISYALFKYGDTGTCGLNGGQEATSNFVWMNRLSGNGGCHN